MKKHSNYLHPIFTKSYLPHIQYIRKKKELSNQQTWIPHKTNVYTTFETFE